MAQILIPDNVDGVLALFGAVPNQGFEVLGLDIAQVFDPPVPPHGVLHIDLVLQVS